MESSSRNSALSFFTILIADFESQMRIPRVFARQLGFVSKKYVLEGPRSSVHVSAEKTDTIWYFQDGWSSFVEDHSLEYGDSLLFQYVENATFQVTVYGMSCCEKFDEIDEIHAIVPKPNKKGKKIMRANQQDKLDANNALEAASTFASELEDAFCKVLKEAYISHGYFSLPVKFYRKYMQGIADGENIKLELNGNEWDVKMKTVEGHGGRLSAGWPAFVLDNDLKEGDVCVFQLVQTGDIKLKVTCYSNYVHA